MNALGRANLRGLQTALFAANQTTAIPAHMAIYTSACLTSPTGERRSQKNQVMHLPLSFVLTDRMVAFVYNSPR